MLFLFQDEKNQIMTTNMWLKQVCTGGGNNDNQQLSKFLNVILFSVS